MAVEYDTMMRVSFSTTPEIQNFFQRAQALDAEDELASFRDQFVINDPELIYLLANSLGRLPKAAVAHMATVVQQEWGERLIRGWNEGWIDLPQRLGNKLGHLLGARPGEILVADSTSVNLFKLVVAGLRARPGRTKVVTDNLNFPSDLYILQGAVQAAGGRHQLEMIASPDGIHGPVEALRAAIDQDTALVALSHTVFKSGYTYDMAALTAQAHAAGAFMLWDVSHAAGVVPIDFQEAGVDLAVGCTYKYLCGGPGSPAFLYVREDLQNQLHNPVSGWMGQDHPFALALQYQSAPGIRRFLTGTPTILSLSAIEPGLDLILEAGMTRIRRKAERQTNMLMELWADQLQPLGFTLKSPRAAGRRGAHVTFGHPEALRISQALKKEMKVIPDFREPDNLRFAVAPLYTRYVELVDAAGRLRHTVENKLYEKIPLESPKVT